jgi:lysophospholipase L1-like esterase
MTLPLLVGLFDDIIGLWKPDVVILQIGIVDCAPRLFGPRQHAVLSNPLFPRPISAPIIKVMSRYRRQVIKLRPNVRYTKPQRFESSLDKLGQLINALPARAVALPIVDTFAEHEYRTPGYNEAVNAYNEIWRARAKRHNIGFLEPEQVFGRREARELVLSDGHHLTQLGHHLVADALSDWVSAKGREGYEGADSSLESHERLGDRHQWCEQSEYLNEVE